MRPQPAVVLLPKQARRFSQVPRGHFADGLARRPPRVMISRRQGPSAAQQRRDFSAGSPPFFHQATAASWNLTGSPSAPIHQPAAVGRSAGSPRRTFTGQAPAPRGPRRCPGRTPAAAGPSSRQRPAAVDSPCGGHSSRFAQEQDTPGCSSAAHPSPWLRSRNACDGLCGVWTHPAVFAASRAMEAARRHQEAPVTVDRPREMSGFSCLRIMAGAVPGTPAPVGLVPNPTCAAPWFQVCRCGPGRCGPGRWGARQAELSESQKKDRERG